MKSTHFDFLFLVCYFGFPYLMYYLFYTTLLTLLHLTSFFVYKIFTRFSETTWGNIYGSWSYKYGYRINNKGYWRKKSYWGEYLQKKIFFLNFYSFRIWINSIDFLINFFHIFLSYFPSYILPSLLLTWLITYFCAVVQQATNTLLMSTAESVLSNNKVQYQL